MIVMKFGGTSLGNAERIKEVSGLIEKTGDNFVVCSAMSGVTNTLVAIAGSWRDKDSEKAFALVDDLEKKFHATCYELFDDAESSALTSQCIFDHFSVIKNRLNGEYDLNEENWLLAQGEIITSRLMVDYMNWSNISITWLNALELVRTGADGEPSVGDIKQRLRDRIGDNPCGRFLTQGYICLDNHGNIANLRRGGSDYTATLAGAALGAERIEIWTDIDGVRNNDPRIVDNTFPIRELSFDEAAELAYFGAKILHPACVWPASSNNIPIHLRNTMEPNAPGTIIRSDIGKKGITAVAAKEGITMIQIRSDRMLNAYGFLSSIFGIFEKYRTPIDVITTSEVSVSVTIDNAGKLDKIITELGGLGDVTVHSGQAIVCVVGDILEQHKDRAVKILDSVRHFNVRMISFGGSKNNITIVVPEDEREEVLRSLNSFLFAGNQSKTVAHD